MTKYCANIVTDVSEYTIALFSDEVTIKAMAAFAEEQLQFERGEVFCWEGKLWMQTL